MGALFTTFSGALSAIDANGCNHALAVWVNIQTVDGLFGIFHRAPHRNGESFVDC